MIRSIISGLWVAATAGSLLLVASAPVSAESPVPVVANEHVLAPDKPPKITRVRFTCHAGSASVSLRLGNPNRVDLSYQVRLFGGDVQEAQAVALPAKTTERISFGGIPNGEFSIEVLNDLGDSVAFGEVVVECPPVAGGVLDRG